MARVFHLIDPGAWSAATEHGRVAPPSLATEGFVHCSTADQVVATIERHFAGVTELLLLELGAAACADLRWEESRPGETYPHLHRALELDEIVAVVPWRRGPDGSVTLPAALG